MIIQLFFLLLLSPITSVSAATLKSPGNSGLIIETNVTAPPTPTPFRAIVNTQFRLKVSSDLIDFGPLSPTNPSIRELTLSVDPGSSSYNLLAFENHPLKTPNNDIIPDTTCDDGACSEKSASTWSNPFTFGFGFSHVNKEKVNASDLYRQFADLSKHEEPTKLEPGKLTIKVNVGENNLSQAPEGIHYENTIIFLAIPKY